MTTASHGPPGKGRRRRVLVIEQGDGLWGAQRYLLRLAPLLEDEGFEQVLAAPGDSAVARAWRAEGRRHVHFPVPPVRKVRRRGDHGPFSPALVARELARTAANARRVAALAATLQADCIHANGHWSHLEAALGGRLARLPVVLHLHELTQPGVAGRLRAAAVRIADASVAVSNAVADCLPRQTRSRVTVIHNGVDPVSLSPGPADPGVRRELAADPTAPIVLSLCRLDPSKGVDQLIRAVAALDGDLAGTQLAVVGSGELDEGHAARLRELGAELLGERVRFLGPRLDVAALLRSADVFALASASEGLPLVVLEAQACGTPVVAYPAAGTTEIVRDGETGLLARQDDPADLAACIGRVLTDDGLRTRLASAARAQVVAGFTLTQQVEHQVRVLDRLTAANGAPARRAAPRPRQRVLGTPLYRNALALLVNSGVTSLIGVAYWTLAARLTSPEVVGLNAALISAMVGLASLSHLGLEGALGGFLPRAGAVAGTLVKRAYAIAGVLALALGAAFAVAAPRVSDQLRDLYRPGVAALFVGAVVTWSLFALQDSVLTGLRRAVWIPVENVAYSAAKLVLVLALAGGLAGYGILVSWIVPAALALLPVTLAIFKVFLPAHLRAYGDRPGHGTGLFGRFVAGDGLGMLLAQAHATLLPLLVVERAGAAAGGRFYVAWMLAQSLDLVAVNVGMSLTVEGAHVQDELPSMFRRVLLRTLVLVGLLAGVGALAAPLVLALFGAGYAEASAGLLRLLLLGSLLRVVITLAICAARAERRPSQVIVLQASLTVVVLPLAWRLTSALGAAGTAVAWTLGQAAVAAVAVFLTRNLLRRRQPASAQPPLAGQLEDAIGRRGTR